MAGFGNSSTSRRNFNVYPKCLAVWIVQKVGSLPASLRYTGSAIDEDLGFFDIITLTSCRLEVSWCDPEMYIIFFLRTASMINFRIVSSRNEMLADWVGLYAMWTLPERPEPVSWGLLSGIMSSGISSSESIETEDSLSPGIKADDYVLVKITNENKYRVVVTEISYVM